MIVIYYEKVLYTINMLLLFEDNIEDNINAFTAYKLTLSLPIGDVIADCQRRRSATWKPSKNQVPRFYCLLENKEQELLSCIL